MLRSQTWLIFKLDRGSIGGSIICFWNGKLRLYYIYPLPYIRIEGGTFFIDYFTVALLLVYPYILCTSASHFSTIKVR